MKRLIQLLALAPLVLLTPGCAIKAYVIDRHTVLEDEAAGEWPQMEKEIVDKTPQAGPTAFPKAELNARRQRLYNVLDGELVSDKK